LIASSGLSDRCTEGVAVDRFSKHAMHAEPRGQSIDGRIEEAGHHQRRREPNHPPQSQEDTQAAKPWHDEFQDENLGQRQPCVGHGRQQFEGLAAVRGLGHRVAIFSQKLPRGLAEARIVIGQEGRAAVAERPHHEARPTGRGSLSGMGWDCSQAPRSTRTHCGVPVGVIMGDLFAF
jgi:hypothetical protein